MSSSPHLTADLVARWRSRALTPEEVLAVSDHLEECPDCRTELTGARAPAAVAAAIDRQLDREDLTHLSSEELARWVDGTADPVESEVTRSHLAVCDRCRGEAEDLRGFARALEGPSSASRQLRWWTLAAAAVVAAVIGVYQYQPQRALPDRPVSSVPPDRPTGPPALPPPSVTVVRDGALTIRLSAGDVQGIPDAWRDQVAAAWQNPRLALPDAALAVARGAESQRSAGGELEPTVQLTYPLSRVVLDRRPVFRWSGPPDGMYRVEVYDSRFELLAASRMLTSTFWLPSHALPRGEILTWKVVLDLGGQERSYPAPPTPPASFQVATAEAARRVGDAQALGSRLLTGLALWQAGLVTEATAEFEALAEQNPDVSFVQELAAAGGRPGRVDPARSPHPFDRHSQ